MGIPCLILGESGSGKTYSIKTLNPQKTGIFLVEKPRLPFRGEFPYLLRNATYKKIIGSLSAAKLTTYVIDDSQYLLANDFFDRAAETGYQKFTDLALNFRNLIQFVIRNTPDNVIVYFLHHTETDANGKLKAKTIGKMLDEKLTVEGCFDIVLRTYIENGDHYFLTNSNGNDTIKSPEDMFPERIPNNLGEVDKTIREYWGLTDAVQKKENGAAVTTSDKLE